jgi:CubicO group peptidase (beta-lactamase class C family)
MKTTIPTVGLSSILAILSLSAQDPNGPSVSVGERFRQWDKNGDGKLTADEVPGERLFKMLDSNGDGVVTQAEATGFGAGQKQGWRGVGVSTGAPLPRAEGFEPHPHGDEARAAGLDPDVLAKIDVEMQRHVAAGNVAGIAAIIHINGTQGYFETFGMADIEKGRAMGKDAIFRLMSMTIPVIAVAALTLYDEGKFSLDEPISKHLPEWAEPKVQENGQLVPAKSAITPRMLMSHSSGLSYGAGGGAAAMAYGAMTKPGATLKEFSEAVAKEPLKFQPGEGYSYGLGIDILGRYLEAVAGKPLDQVLKERLFGPLKMVDTDFWVPPEKAGRLCQIYSQPASGVLKPGNDTAKVTTKPTLFLGGHGLFGTIGDYERFCRMILNRGELDGVRVLKPETVDLIFQNHLKTPGMKYGLGGIVNGEGSYGWGGADGTQFVIDRKNGLLTLFMVQTQGYKAPAYPVFLALANEAAGDARVPGAGDERKGEAPGARAAPAAPRNEAAATPLARLTFAQEYCPGTHDAAGQFMGGTEAMWLAGHCGKLFAAIGYGQDQPGSDPKPGAQILRKDAPDSPWVVDHEFPRGFMRVEGLVAFAFTTDLHGKALSKPAPLLIAGPSEVAARDTKVAVFVRSDAGEWVRSEIVGGNLGCRSFGSHVDKVTGVHHLFAGLNLGSIHRGSYDPAAPGGIRWEAKPERTAEVLPGNGRRIYDYSRVVCFAECNGDLYTAARITTDAEGQPVDGGLYRRVDGVNASWELAYRWTIDKEVLQSRFLRGLTAVPDPRGGKHQILLAAFEYPGVVRRFDPTRKGDGSSILVEEELDIKAFFNRAWVTPDARRRGAIAAYNRFLPVTDPKSGETVWLCGAWVERPGSPTPPDNGSCYLIRHRDGRCDWGYIYDAAHLVPAGQKLTGCRDIEPSPFPGDEGRVFYFCGYDGGAGPSHNTAWIYKGTLPSKSARQSGKE